MEKNTLLHYWQTAKPVVLTLVIGTLGAQLAPFLHLPVPALLGSAILVSLVAFSRLPLAMPNLLRNIGFTILGCSMGSGITAEMLSLLWHWPLSFAALGITVVLMMLLSTWILTRYFSHTLHTALLASTPGALSTVIALTSDGKCNVRAVIVLQCMRLIAVMAVLPIIIQAIGFPQGEGSHVIVGLTPSLTWPRVALLLCLAFSVALLLERYKVPAAYLLAGLLFSGVGHVNGWLTGNLPAPMITMGFITIGCVIGIRFRGIQWAELRQFGTATFVSVGLSSLLSALAAVIVSQALDLSFGQVWIAFSPGGIEAMAALALALQYDPAYIAAHHLVRIIGLTLLLPWVARYMKITP